MSRKPLAIDPDVRQDIETARTEDGWVAEQVDNRDFNELAFRAIADHVWGTATQVSLGESTFYTDASGNPIAKGGGAQTFVDDDRILIGHDVVATANILFNAGGKRVTMGMMPGVILDISTFDLDLTTGSDIIAGNIKVTGTTGDVSAVGSPELVVNDNRTQLIPKFDSSDDLIINVDSNTTVTSTAGYIRVTDDNNNGFLLESYSELFDITTDLNAGSEKVTTDYGMWIGCDYLGNIQRLLVPDIESVTDGVSAGKLIDSAATFTTDAVQVGDIVYNLTDGTQTTVNLVDSQTQLDLVNDIFTSGESYKIRIETPQFEATKVFKDRIGTAFNNSSSNLSNSYYAQIQSEKSYDELNSNFYTITSTPALVGLNRAMLTVSQTLDWAGKGHWFVDGKVSIQVASGVRTSCVLAITGILFKNISAYDQASSGFTTGAGANFIYGLASANTNTITAVHASSTTQSYLYSLDKTEQDVKPGFHN